MVPPAPPTFSTIIVWPSDFIMLCATRRATVSVGPPAPNGTTMVIARVGKSWAALAIANASIAHAAKSLFGIENPPLFFCARFFHGRALRRAAIIISILPVPFLSESPRDPRLPPRPAHLSGEGPRAPHGLLRARGLVGGEAPERGRSQFGRARVDRSHGGGAGPGDADHGARRGDPPDRRLAPRRRDALRNAALPRDHADARGDREGVARAERRGGREPPRGVAGRAGRDRRRGRRRAARRRACAAGVAPRHLRPALLVPRPSRAHRTRALSAGAARGAQLGAPCRARGSRFRMVRGARLLRDRLDRAARERFHLRRGRQFRGCAFLLALAGGLLASARGGHRARERRRGSRHAARRADPARRDARRSPRAWHGRARARGRAREPRGP